MKDVRYVVETETRYRVVRQYFEAHEDGTTSGGVESFGTFDREDTAERIRAMLLQDEFARDAAKSFGRAVQQGAPQ